MPLDQVPAQLAYADERRLLEKVDGLLADHDAGLPRPRGADHDADSADPA